MASTYSYESVHKCFPSIFEYKSFLKVRCVHRALKKSRAVYQMKWLHSYMSTLPIEIVAHIWELSFPRTQMRCTQCKSVCLSIDEDKIFTQERPYTLLDDCCICLTCRDG
jgi:hypothetical protein